jgi:hypothetical protein
MGKQNRHLRRFGPGYKTSQGKQKKKKKIKGTERESDRYVIVYTHCL